MRAVLIHNHKSLFRCRKDIAVGILEHRNGLLLGLHKRLVGRMERYGTLAYLMVNHIAVQLGPVIRVAAAGVSLAAAACKGVEGCVDLDLGLHYGT